MNHTDYTREWGRKHPESKKNSHLKSRYGITLDQFKEIELKQNGLCAICDQPLPVNPKFHQVDHNHRTNHLRGILCFSCNRLIGACGENYLILAKAIDYLMDDSEMIPNWEECKKITDEFLAKRKTVVSTTPVYERK
jgi:hypothetical protein